MAKIKLRLAIISLLLLSAAWLSTVQSRVQIGQGCGEPSVTETNTNWIWQWLRHRGDPNFVTCVGPSHYLVYRPLDLAAGLLIATGMMSIPMLKIRTKANG